MKWLLIVALVAAILGVGDVLARVYVEEQLEEGVEQRLTGVGDVDADISSFPFLGRLIARGAVDRASIELTDVAGHGIPVASLRVEVDGLRFDRSTAFDSQRIQVTGVDLVTVAATITRADLHAEFGAVAGAGFDVLDGTSITVGPNELSLAGVRLPFGAGDLLPCDASATVGRDRIDLSCRTDRLPPILVAAIGSIDLRDQLGR